MSDPDPKLNAFLDLATHRLEADPQARDEARHELLVRIVSAEDAEAAATRLRGRKPGRTWIYPAIASAAVIVLGTVTALFIRSTVKEIQPLVQVSTGRFNLDEVEITSEGERDFVSARLHENSSGQLHNLERLVHERPEDRGLFEEYTGLSVANLHKLPPNYRETWQRIDPGNGAWLLRESMMRASDAFKGSGGSGPVTDEAAFTEALVLLAQAADMERFEFYAADLRRRRLALLPEPESLGDEAGNMLLAISSCDPAQSRFQQFCGALIREKAKRLGDAKDTEGLRELITIWRKLSHRLGTRSTTLLDSVTALGFTVQAKEALLGATIQLGMVEDQKQFDAVDHLSTGASSIFRGSPHRKAMSWMAGGSGLASPPPNIATDPSRFEAGRKVEFALADRLFALGAALLCLLLLAVAGIESVRRGRILNAVGDGLAPLFRLADSAWILGLGLLAPAAYYWLVTRVTPFGCRDIGVLYYSTPPPVLQALAGLLLTWASLQTVIRRRVARHIAFLGAHRGGMPLDVVSIVLLAMLVPAIGGVRWLHKNEEDYLKAMAAACGMPFLWLVWQAGTVLLAPRSAALPGLLLARKLVIPLLLLAGTLLAAVPVLRDAERDWLRKDTLGRTPRDAGGITRGEDLAVRWIADHFEEAFVEKP
jgi:hypothetical protein